MVQEALHEDPACSGVSAVHTPILERIVPDGGSDGKNRRPGRNAGLQLQDHGLSLLRTVDENPVIVRNGNATARR